MKLTKEILETAKIPRGFSAIGLVSPKTGANVGGVMRAAHCYGSSFIALENIRQGAIKAGANVTRSERAIPTFFTDDVLSLHPHGTEIVAVDLVDNAKDLVHFPHPERALYIFGPEDGTLGERITQKAHHRVFVPTRYCMNLASCVNVVLYDRMVKVQRGLKYQGRWGDVYA